MKRYAARIVRDVEPDAALDAVRGAGGLFLKWESDKHCVSFGGDDDVAKEVGRLSIVILPVSEDR